MEELRFKRFAHPSIGPELAPSDFFLFGLLKGELFSRPISEINGRFEIAEEMLSTLTSDTIARVFAHLIERLKQIIDTNGD
jgi:hypothetical protein